jgi:chromate transporter
MVKGLFKLFNIMVGTGFIGFGGGNALIPVLHRKTVVENTLLTDDEYNEEVLIASITPGALPVEIAGGIGSRLYGWKGMLIGAYGMALPGVICTIVLLIVYEYISESVLVQIKFASVGVSGYICIMLWNYVKGTFDIKSECNYNRKRYAYIFTTIIVAVLTCEKNIYRIIGIQKIPIFGLSSIDIFILVFISVILKTVISDLVGKKYRNEKSGSTEKEVCQIYRIIDILTLAAVMAISYIVAYVFVKDLFSFVIKGCVSTLLSFGGGDAYLTIADSIFIDSGLISESYFYGNIVPIVNILPGSILCKTLSGIGFYIGNNSSGNIIGGVAVALLGFSISVFFSCGIFSLIHIFYGTLKYVSAFIALKDMVRPVVSGLMFNVALSLIYQTIRIDGISYMWEKLIIMFALFVIGGVLFRNNISNDKIIAIMISVSLIMCNLAL